jgi:hypothetical protein
VPSWSAFSISFENLFCRFFGNELQNNRLWGGRQGRRFWTPRFSEANLPEKYLVTAFWYNFLQRSLQTHLSAQQLRDPFGLTRTTPHTARGDMATAAMPVVLFSGRSLARATPASNSRCATAPRLTAFHAGKNISRSNRRGSAFTLSKTDSLKAMCTVHPIHPTPYTPRTLNPESTLHPEQQARLPRSSP